MIASVLIMAVLLAIIFWLSQNLSDVKDTLAATESGRRIPAELHNKIAHEVEDRVKRELYVEFLDALNSNSTQALRNKIESDLKLLADRMETRTTREELHNFLNLMGDDRAKYYKDE